MDRWNEYAFPKIAAEGKKDKIYLELKAENRILEQKYVKVMEKMSASEQELVDFYIASCVNLEFRLAQIAYQIALCENH